ncbi:MAG: hypothetical protein M1831_005666 [Alyxoria varia]|nr:MAG: hypothetical protein M1831_005666 [Alyxoria varia]
MASPPHPNTVRPIWSNLRQDNLPNWQAFCTDLETAVQRCLPTQTAAYTKVAVLSITFAQTNIPVAHAESRLESVLTKKYGFKFERYAIQVRDRSTQQDYTPIQIRDDVKQRLKDFTNKHDQRARSDDKSLLIYYFSGHAQGGSDDNLWLFGSPTDYHLAVNWHAIKPFAVDAILGDPLLLFDCCDAAFAAKSSNYELLSACAAGSSASGSAYNCFTTVFCDELEQLNGEPTTVATVHSLIANDFHNKNLDVSPVHVPHIDGKPSIVLQRPAPSSHMVVELRANRAVPNAVIINVQLSSPTTDIPKKDDWVKWLTTHLPPSVEDVRIRYAMDTGSSLAMIQIPIPLWDYLPSKTCYKFVQHVAGTATGRPGIGGRKVPSGWANVLIAKPAPSTGSMGGSVFPGGGKGKGPKPGGSENVRPGAS